MRLPALAPIAAAVAAFALPAAAQVAPYADHFDILRAQNRAAMEQDEARRQALAADRAAFAAQQRARTALRLQDLRLRQPPLAVGAPVVPAPLDAQMAADAAAIARIQDQALAASNARILAIKPASVE